MTDNRTLQLKEKKMPTSKPINISNVKAKLSDENLSLEKDILDSPIDVGKQRKRSVVSLPSEGEEEDEFMFSQLKKQIKSHWNKIMENYPNSSMFFRTPTLKAEAINEEKSEKDGTAISHTTSSSISSVDFEQNLLGSAMKSVFLLPNFSCKRDDNGRRCVPFISSLLQVTKIKVHKESNFLILM